MCRYLFGHPIHLCKIAREGGTYVQVGTVKIVAFDMIPNHAFFRLPALFVFFLMDRAYVGE